jgi:hypothetical protein
MDDDRAFRSNVAPHTARYLLEPVIREELSGLSEEEEEEKEPNVQESILRMSGGLGEERGLEGLRKCKEVKQTS